MSREKYAHVVHARVTEISPAASIRARTSSSADSSATVYAKAVAAPEVLRFREFCSGLAGVLDRVRRSPDAAVFVGAHRRAEAMLVSVEQYEALQEAAERQRAVAAALASVRAEGLEPNAEDLVLLLRWQPGGCWPHWEWRARW